MTVTQRAQFTIGAEVSCTDGVCGEVSRVVVDPVARAVTHLVVQPGPHFLPGSSGFGSYGPEQALSWPYYGLGIGGGLGDGMGTGMGIGLENPSRTVTYDNVPPGQVEVRRGEHVHATDGDIGQVQGLVIDPRDHHVTHVLLQEGTCGAVRKCPSRLVP